MGQTFRYAVIEADPSVGDTIDISLGPACRAVASNHGGSGAVVWTPSRLMTEKLACSWSDSSSDSFQELNHRFLNAVKGWVVRTLRRLYGFLVIFFEIFCGR